MFLPWNFLKEFDSIKNCGCHSNKTEKKLKTLKIFLSETIRVRAVTGRFAPKTFPPWSFHLYFSPLVVLPPCPSRFAPTPFPPLVVSPPVIEKDKVFIIGFSSVLRKSFYKYTGNMALYNLHQKCM